MKQPASEYRDSMLWSAVDAMLGELVASGELAINTAPDYVVAHVSRELVAKKLIAEGALRNPRDDDARS
jgi:hypothetical protein